MSKKIVLFLLITSIAIPLSAQPYGPGDVNFDGSVDIIDALLVSQYYVGYNPPNFDPILADVNCDRKVDILDALLIAQYYVQLFWNSPVHQRQHLPRRKHPVRHLLKHKHRFQLQQTYREPGK